MTMTVPYVMVHPRITVEADAATPIDIECSANEVHALPDQDEVTWKTFCGTGTIYGAETWTVELNVLQSFGVDGLWNVLRPLVGTVTAFELLPDTDAAVSESNPLMTGPALVKAFPFLDGSAGEPSEITVAFAMQGIPEFLNVPPAGTMAARADEDEDVEAAA